MFFKKDLIRKGKRKFEIYQGDITVIVYGVAAYCTTFDVPASRVYHDTQCTYIMTSIGKINVLKGILIDTTK